MLLDEIPEALIITMNDISRAGYCASGARRWFEAHGLDFRDMLANGIPARVMYATGDACGMRVVECKMKSTDNG